MKNRSHSRSPHRRKSINEQQQGHSPDGNAKLEKVRIIIRIRPTLRDESEEDFIKLVEAKTLKIMRPGSSMMMKFNNILPQASTQNDVFYLVQEAVHSFLQGTNNTVFAYGQTGSGKTYTVLGDYSENVTQMNPEKIFKKLKSTNRGILPRALELILKQLQASDASQYQLCISFYEVYNEKIYDLFSTKENKDGLDIREQKGTVSIPDLITIKISSLEHALNVLCVGLKNRITGSTVENAQSSRSHSVFQITLQQARSDYDDCYTESSLRIVDLAGCEKFKIPHDISAAEKEIRIQELTSINGSLSSLGHCISALIDRSRTHIPFRNSKLTRVLSDCLSGNGKIAFIVCISPSITSNSESFSTLQFANRAKRVILDSRNLKNLESLSSGLGGVNKKILNFEELQELQQQLQKERSLRQELERMLRQKSPVSDIQMELIYYKQENQELKEQIRRLEAQVSNSVPSSEQKVSPKKKISPRHMQQDSDSKNKKINCRQGSSGSATNKKLSRQSTEGQYDSVMERDSHATTTNSSQYCQSSFSNININNSNCLQQQQQQQQFPQHLSEKLKIIETADKETIEKLSIFRNMASKKEVPQEFAQKLGEFWSMKNSSFCEDLMSGKCTADAAIKRLKKKELTQKIQEFFDMNSEEELDVFEDTQALKKRSNNKQIQDEDFVDEGGNFQQQDRQQSIRESALLNESSNLQQVNRQCAPQQESCYIQQQVGEEEDLESQQQQFYQQWLQNNLQEQSHNISHNQTDYNVQFETFDGREECEPAPSHFAPTAAPTIVARRASQSDKATKSATPYNYQRVEIEEEEEEEQEEAESQLTTRRSLISHAEEQRPALRAIDANVNESASTKAGIQNKKPKNVYSVPNQPQKGQNLQCFEFEETSDSYKNNGNAAKADKNTVEAPFEYRGRHNPPLVTVSSALQRFAAELSLDEESVDKKTNSVIIAQQSEKVKVDSELLNNKFDSIVLNVNGQQNNITNIVFDLKNEMTKAITQLQMLQKEDDKIAM